MLLTFLHIWRFYGIAFIPKVEFFFYCVNCTSLTCNGVWWYFESGSFNAVYLEGPYNERLC